MTEKIKFYFDPICPWCYQTSRWIKRLEELGEVELSWGVFSLEIQNLGKEPEELQVAHSRSALSLRTAIKIRDEAGEKAVGAFYSAIGARIHDQAQNPKERETVVGALTDAGLDPALADKAEADDATWDAVIAEHKQIAERTKAFGVPTIVLDDGEGPQLFGPVVYEPPDDDDEARALLEHTVWLTRYENFAELKRERTRPLELESVRQARERRRKRLEEEAARQKD